MYHRIKRKEVKNDEPDLKQILNEIEKKQNIAEDNFSSLHKNIKIMSDINNELLKKVKSELKTELVEDIKILVEESGVESKTFKLAKYLIQTIFGFCSIIMYIMVFVYGWNYFRGYIINLELSYFIIIEIVFLSLGIVFTIWYKKTKEDRDIKTYGLMVVVIITAITVYASILTIIQYFNS